MPKVFVLYTLYFLLFLMAPGIIIAQEQEYTFRHLTTEDGLSSNRINEIIKDSDGFMWFATGNGFTRYDGYTCKTYFPNKGDPSSYPNNNITALIEDHNGILWIGTSETGLYTFNRKTEAFSNYQYNASDSSSISSNQISDIYQDNLKTIWIGTTGGGLNKFHPETKKFIVYQQAPDTSDYPGNKISSMCEDQSGIFWIGGRDGVFQFDRQNKKFIPFDLGYYIPEVKKYITCIFEDSGRQIWFGTTWGLFKYNPATGQIDHFFGYDFRDNDKQLNNVNIIDIVETFENRNQIFWITTAFGLEKYIVNKDLFLTIYNDPDNSNSISSSSVLTLFYDESGILWVGSNDGINLLNLNKNEFLHFNERTGSVSKSTISASCFSVDKEKNIWIGSHSRGLNKLDSSWNNVLQLWVHEVNTNDPEVSVTNSIDCIYTDSEGTLWMGVWLGGIYYYTKTEEIIKKLEFNTPDEFTKPDKTLEILEDRSGKLWFATNSGLYTKEIKTSKTEPLLVVDHDKLSHLYITAVVEDKYSQLWVGTSENGLFCLKPSDRSTNTFIQYKREENDHTSISNNQITDLYTDTDGFLWISTNGGLNRRDRETGVFEDFNHIIDPSSILIYDILGDHSGYIWLNTSRGIIRFNPDIEINRAIKIFDMKDGIPFESTEAGAFYQSEDGRIFAGGKSYSNDGFFCFYPDSIKDNTNIPPVFITNFQIRNQPAILNSNITYKKEILLKYDENFFSFEFTALDYKNPESNRFAYILEGFDKDWIYLESRRNANYTGVPPGDYTFRVIASNSDGYWNEKGVGLRVTIFPPPWKTWWAYLIYGLFVIGIIFAWRRYDLKRQQLKRTLEVEHVEAEKLKELDTLKSRFFANISHEFRTPLTLILGPLQNLISKSKGKKEKQDLSLIQHNAFRLQHLINQLLSLSKLESGKMKLRASESDIIPLIRGYVQSFESLAKQKQIDLAFTTEIVSLDVWFDLDKMEKILFNLLSNAFKFTSGGGRIEVILAFSYWPLAINHKEEKTKTDRLKSTANQNGQAVEIKISDTGSGISKEKLPHIFDRFYQADDSYTKDGEGTGIGLALTRELVELHHGMIDVESEVGIGSVFRIDLPLGREHLSPGEIDANQQSAIGNRQDEVQVKTSHVDSLVSHNDRAPLSVPHAPESDVPLVLIVEDNADLRMYIRGYLDETYRVIEAENGRLGLEHAIEFVPDLIISDVMMPRMDGFELCAKLKSDERTSHIPVILLTARATVESKIEGLETGADDFITKPFDAPELLVRIRNLIKQRKTLQSWLLKNTKRSGIEQLFNIDTPGLASMDQQFYQKVLQIIINNLSNPDFTVEKLASNISLSHSQLHRKMVALTGQPVNQLIRTIRLARAAELLASKTATVTEIAFDVGFSNLSYFSKCFKEQFGVLPSEYSNNRN